ncbi:hypothetical protein LLG39_00735 [bacterium]|nr:hypothetical protein [bacterium]
MHKIFLKLCLLMIAIIITCPAEAIDYKIEKLGRLPSVVIENENDLKLWTPERIRELNNMEFPIDLALCKKSPYDRHVGIVELLETGKCCMWLDGKEGSSYDQIRNVVKGAYSTRDFCFSPDGRRVAYTARIGKKWVMVVDGKESAEFDGIREPYFSADSKHVCFVGFRGGKAIFVMDGKESQQYHGIVMRFPSFSAKTPLRVVENSYCPCIFGANGHYAYVVANERDKNGLDHERAVIDGRMSADYQGIQGMEFSLDGSRVAFVARKGDHMFVVLDGKAGEKYDDIDGMLTFSPDGKHLAYVATNYNENSDPVSFVVVDGKRGPKLQDIVSISVIFSPDSKHITYTATPDGEKYSVFIDGKPGKGYDEIGERNWTPCQMYGKDGKLYYKAKLGEKYYMVIDGVPSPAYDDISEDYPVFSRDGKHYAYSAKMGDYNWFVVHDGARGPSFAGINYNSTYISGADKLVYTASIKDSSDYVTVVDGKEYPGNGSVILSPDGSRVVSIKKSDDQQNECLVVVDGQEIGSFMSILNMNFDQDNALTFLAIRNEITGDKVPQNLYRVQIAPSGSVSE